jgi:hypothetical protein
MKNKNYIFSCSFFRESNVNSQKGNLSRIRIPDKEKFIPDPDPVGERAPDPNPQHWV